MSRSKDKQRRRARSLIRRAPELRRDFKLDPAASLRAPAADALCAASLFVVFNIECERFDRTVCTGVPAEDGSGVMPLNTTQLGITSRHASALAAELLTRAERLGLSKPVLEAGEAFVMRMPYPVVESEYGRALRVIGGPLDP